MKVTNALKCLAVIVLMAWLFPAAALAQYVRTDLTSDQPGVASNTSPHLVNGWGLVQLGTSPFWISDNGTGLSTLYNNTSRGRVNAFDPTSGEFLGPLRDASGNAIEIDNVWAIQFGHDGGPGGTPHNSLFTSH